MYSIRLVPLLLVAGVDTTLAVILAYMSLLLLRAWKVSREERIGMAAAGFLLVSLGLLGEAVLLAFFAYRWRGGTPVPEALSRELALNPFSLLYLAGYILFASSYLGGRPLVAIAADARAAWALISLSAAATSALVAVVSSRRGAPRLFSLGFLLVAVSHAAVVFPSPRFLLVYSLVRCAGFLLVAASLSR